MLMQADTTSVPRSMVESSVKQALDRRGMMMDPSTNLRALIEGDKHFIVDHSVPDGDNLVGFPHSFGLFANECMRNAACVATVHDILHVDLCMGMIQSCGW